MLDHRSVAGHQCGHLVQGKAETAIHDDRGQAPQIRGVVEPIPGVGATTGLEQADLVVVVQRAHGDAVLLGDLSDGEVLHRGSVRARRGHVT